MKANPYRMIMVTHPVTGGRIQVQEHVYIWLLANDLWQKGQTSLERPLVIHHKDFNPRNNDIANLERITQSEHMKIHWDRDRETRGDRVSKALRKRHATKTPEERAAMVEKARFASIAKVKRDGPTPAQLAGLQKARSFAYGGTRTGAKVLTAEEIAEIRAIYPTIKKKHGAVKGLAERFAIDRRRLCRIALS